MVILQRGGRAVAAGPADGRGDGRAPAAARGGRASVTGRGGRRGPRVARRRPDNEGLDWDDSAQQRLLQLVQDEAFRGNERPRSTRAHFEPYKCNQFNNRFYTQRGRVAQELDMRAFDAAAFRGNRLLVPRNETTARGDPFWDEHAARPLLRHDIQNRLIEGLSPTVARRTRPEYMELTLFWRLRHPTLRSRNLCRLPTLECFAKLGG